MLRERRLFKLRPTRGIGPWTRTSHIKGKASLQAPPDIWQCTQNTSLAFQESRLPSIERSASPPWSLRYFNQVRAASPLRCSRLFDEWESRFYLGSRLPGNMTFASTRPALSLFFCNQFNSTLAKADDYSPNSTVHQQPAQSTEEVWTAYPDTHNDHFWWLQRV